MTSLKASFQENSESERQGVIIAWQSASSLQRKMLQATTACTSWKSEVLKLTKEVAEQSTKRIAGRKSSHDSSAHLPPSRIDYSQPFTPTEKVDSPFQQLRPAEGTPKEHIPSTSTALSDTRSVTDESTSKREEAEKFESEQWAQAPRVKPVLRTNSSSSSSMPVAIFWKAFVLPR